MFARGFTKAAERLIVTAGKRIQADFSSAVAASRMLFQTFSRDSTTSVGAVPNGTPPANATSAQFAVYNKFDASSGNVGRLRINATEVALDSDVVTAGSSHIPLAFYTGGALRFQLDPSSNRFVADFSSATVANRLLFQTSAANSVSSCGIIPNGTGNGASLFTMSTSNADQSSTCYIQSTATESVIGASRTGSASYNPMTFYVNAAKRLELTTSGDVTYYNNVGTLNASFAHRASDASATNNRAFYLSLQNETAINVSSVVQYVATDGSSLIDFYVTPAGSRASDRRFLAWRISPTGWLLDNNRSMPTLCSRRGSTQTSGTTIICSTVDMQQGSNYNNGTGVFTAPVAGVYSISFFAIIRNDTGSASSASVGISASGYTNPLPQQTIPNASHLTFTQTRQLYLTAGATISITSSVALSGTFYCADAQFDVALLR